MSRKTSPLPGSGPRPSYPRDSDPNHRAFLIRSLDKCDEELAVLMKLNKTLHSSRANVVQQCGEAVLLEIGQGKIRLVQGQDALEGTSSLMPPEELHSVCIDFLLRMKLRRRLLNRLARRLNRISHAVDGEDVSPPQPPRYGDLSLHIDPAAVDAFGERLRLQKEAQERIQEAKYQEEEAMERAMEERAKEREEQLKKEQLKKDEEKRKDPKDEPVVDEGGMQPKGGDASKKQEEQPKEEDGEPTVDEDGMKTKGDGPLKNQEEPPKEVDSEPMVVEGGIEMNGEGPSTKQQEPPKEDAGEPRVDEDGMKANRDGPSEKQEEPPKDLDSEPMVVEGAIEMNGEGPSTKQEEPPKEDAREPRVDEDGMKANGDGPSEKQEEPPKEEKDEPMINEEVKGEPMVDDEQVKTNGENIKGDCSESQQQQGTNGSKEGIPQQKDVVVTPTKAPKEEPKKEMSNDTSKPPPPATSAAVHVMLRNQDDYEVFKEYNDTYEKAIDRTTGDVKYTILDQEIEEDHEAIKYGAGIGAAHRSMSAREKEADFKRWQHTLLGRIPDQPTLKELGLENRVYMLKERLQLMEEGDADEKKEQDTPKKNNKRKSSENDQEESPKKKKARKTSSTKGETVEEEEADVSSDQDSETKTNDTETADDTMGESGVDTEPMETDDGEKEETDGGDQEQTDGETEDVEMDDADDTETQEDDDDDEDYSDDEGGKKKDNESKKDSQDKAEEGKDDDKEEQNEEDDRSRLTIEGSLVHEKKKTMSLAAIPSFYEQDMRRIRLIHADLMVTSIHEHARLRISEATKDYNNSFARSNAVYNQRVKVQEELNRLLYEIRLSTSKVKNDYALEVAIARSRWQKRMEHWNAQKMQTLMPSYAGRVAIGTPLTAAASSRPDPIAASVGMTLSNVVDGVVTMVESGLKAGDPEKFVPPPAPSFGGIVDPKTGETLQQKQNRLEASLRAEVTALSIRLQKSEEERKRTWKKMLKTRAEFELPNQQWRSGGKKGRGLDPNKLQMLPVPHLRASAPAVPPPAVGYSSSVPAYVPPMGSSRTPLVTRPFGGVPYASDSKYSVAKVKERIAADGTVAPVSEPKKNKDGLYQRPAGRTRKGMEWDGVRGIWVPAPGE